MTSKKKEKVSCHLPLIGVQLNKALNTRELVWQFHSWHSLILVTKLFLPFLVVNVSFYNNTCVIVSRSKPIKIT